MPKLRDEVKSRNLSRPAVLVLPCYSYWFDWVPKIKWCTHGLVNFACCVTLSFFVFGLRSGAYVHSYIYKVFRILYFVWTLLAKKVSVVGRRMRKEINWPITTAVQRKVDWQYCKFVNGDRSTDKLATLSLSSPDPSIRLSLTENFLDKVHLRERGRGAEVRRHPHTHSSTT